MGSEKLCPRNIPEQALKDDGSDPVKNQSQEKRGERGLNRGSQQRRPGRQGPANRASLRQEEGYFTGEKSVLDRMVLDDTKGLKDKGHGELGKVAETMRRHGLTWGASGHD